MKKYLFFMLLLMAMPLMAQNECRVGDKLTRYSIYNIQFDKVDGQGLVWDISSLGETCGSQTLQFFTNRDTSFLADVASFDQRTKYLYKRLKSLLFVVGFQNKQVRVKYERPEMFLHFPLAYGDSTSGFFSAKGDDVLGHFVRIFGKYNYKVSGLGTLITMDGDTLRQTLLVHRARWVATHYGDKESMLLRYGCLDNVPCLSSTELKTLLAQNSNLVKNDIYLWYTPGYRYPILQQETISSPEGALLYASTLYCPVEQQEELNDDQVNEDIRSNIKQYKEYPVISGKPTDSVVLVGNDYKVSFAPSGSSLELEYTLNKEAEVSYGIYSQDGLVLYREPSKRQKLGSYHEVVKCGGIYRYNKIFTLFVNGMPFSKIVR